MVTICALGAHIFIFADATTDFCSQVKTTLNKGTAGVQVTSLQKKLVTEGLLADKTRINFDADTFNAVKSFQKKNGLAQVGNVGPGTLAKMRSLWCVAKPQPAVVIPTATSTSGNSFKLELTENTDRISPGKQIMFTTKLTNIGTTTKKIFVGYKKCGSDDIKTFFDYKFDGYTNFWDTQVIIGVQTCVQQNGAKQFKELKPGESVEDKYTQSIFDNSTFQIIRTGKNTDGMHTAQAFYDVIDENNKVLEKAVSNTVQFITENKKKVDYQNLSVDLKVSKTVIKQGEGVKLVATVKNNSNDVVMYKPLALTCQMSELYFMVDDNMNAFDFFTPGRANSYGCGELGNPFYNNKLSELKPGQSNRTEYLVNMPEFISPNQDEFKKRVGGKHYFSAYFDLRDNNGPIKIFKSEKQYFEVQLNK
jgi:peptidoglycan hydrolase-like protein with peptidoglycan-binding domain